MHINKTKTKSGHDFYLLIDNNGNVVEPVLKYLKHLFLRDMSKNTIKQNAYNLMVFWEYLDANGFDYIEFVGEVSDTCKGAYENLADYKVYLLYPDIKNKITPIGGIERERKPSSVNQMLSSVISFYMFLAITKVVGELPVISQMCTLPSARGMLEQMFLTKLKSKQNLLLSTGPQDEDIKYITAEEFKKCWDACTSRRNRVIIGLMYYGGLRVSEVIGINLLDLKDIDENIIYIEFRDDKDNTDAAVKYHKRHPKKEPVIIDDILRDEIIAYINKDLRGISTDYLIINFRMPNLYCPMKADTIRDMLDNLGKKVGFKVNPHRFRHGCAMRMLYADMDMKDIADKLRHVSQTTTANIYARYDTRAKISAQEKLAAHLNEKFAPYDIDLDKLAEELKEVVNENE